MIPFIDLQTQQEKIKPELDRRLAQVLAHGKYILGPEVQELEAKLADYVGVKHCITCANGTDALLIALMALGIKAGDEVITTAFTYVATGEVIARLGATPVFVDIDEKTYNLDASKIEAAITDKTRVICPVHYAGVACEMDTIMDIAKRHNLMVVEDAAQAVMSTYKGKALGTIGDFGCFSFHETKNYSMGEGGAIVINNEKYIEKAEILREKGTNRSQFFRGQVAKYNWVDFGDSYLQSDLNAAYLWAQLEMADEINNNRLATWNAYYEAFKPLEENRIITLPTIPEGCVHNAHMFYIKCKDLETRQDYIQFMRSFDIGCVFHYVPLHSAPAGLKFGRFDGKDEHTTPDSDRLVRLPMYYDMSKEDIQEVIDKTLEYFNGL